jgi:hypothetical protein
MNDRTSLLQAVTESFADMAFIDAVPVQNPEILPEASHILYISFSKPISGDISLYLSTPCKQKIVENVYGKEWIDLQDEEIDDCLLELVNVLAGRFLKYSFDETEKHSMSLPQLLFDDAEVPDMPQRDDCFFDAEGVIFKVEIGLEWK